MHCWCPFPEPELTTGYTPGDPEDIAQQCAGTISFFGFTCQSYCAQWWPTGFPTGWPAICCQDCIGGRPCPTTACGVGTSTSFDCENNWDPASEVDFVSNVYTIEYGFLNTVITDPAPLFLCDDAAVVWDGDTGAWVIDNADSGELIYELGLRDGDILIDINGQPLESFSDLWEAVALLWFEEAETTYELTVIRDTNTTYLDYEVYAVF